MCVDKVVKKPEDPFLRIWEGLCPWLKSERCELGGCSNLTGFRACFEILCICVSGIQDVITAISILPNYVSSITVWSLVTRNEILSRFVIMTSNMFGQAFEQTGKILTINNAS